MPEQISKILSTCNLVAPMQIEFDASNLFFRLAATNPSQFELPNPGSALKLSPRPSSVYFIHNLMNIQMVMMRYTVWWWHFTKLMFGIYPNLDDDDMYQGMYSSKPFEDSKAFYGSLWQYVPCLEHVLGIIWSMSGAYYADLDGQTLWVDWIGYGYAHRIVFSLPCFCIIMCYVLRTMHI